MVPSPAPYPLRTLMPAQILLKMDFTKLLHRLFQEMYVPEPIYTVSMGVSLGPVLVTQHVSKKHEHMPSNYCLGFHLQKGWQQELAPKMVCILFFVFSVVIGTGSHAKSSHMVGAL